MFCKIISTSLGEHQILAIPTQNQFNIRSSLLVDKVFQITSRILIESPKINLGPNMELQEKDILHLSQASETDLINWAKDHNLIISKIDYVAKKTFRTDPYTLFMCDVSLEDKKQLEDNMEKVSSFTKEEIQTYTKGSWWKAINEHGDYQTLCYKALRTLKETPLLDLDQTANILNYCGIKIDNPNPKLLTDQAFIDDLTTWIESISCLYYKSPSQHSWKKDISAFIAALPAEDKLIIHLSRPQTFSKRLIFTTTLNKVWLYLADTNAAISRPSGGVSHRNRFGSALDRVSATFLPEVKPPISIHDQACNGWYDVTKHDITHVTLENINLSREGWIAFATHILEHAKPLLNEDDSNDLYNHLLDRYILSPNFEEAFNHALELFIQNNSAHEAIKKSLQTLSNTWHEKNSEFFFNNDMIRASKLPIMQSVTHLIQAIPKNTNEIKI